MVPPPPPPKNPKMAVSVSGRRANDANYQHTPEWRMMLVLFWIHPCLFPLLRACVRPISSGASRHTHPRVHTLWDSGLVFFV